MGEASDRIRRIDIGRLDEEWVLQDERVGNVGKKLAAAKYFLDKAKDALGVVQAEAELEIRSKPLRFGLTKPVREAAVKLAVALHKKVRAAQAKLNRKKFNVAILETDYRRLDHRKKALEDLVTLHGRDYFAAPREPADAGSEEFVSRVRAIGKRKLRNKGR